jgi:single-stranded DNA-binding protein
MTALALITGALFRAPEIKTAKSGKAYCTATIKVAADNAVDFWSVLAFSEAAQAELMRLGEGDKISAQGSFKVEPYTARDGQTRINRTIFADHVLALRQPRRERKPKAAPADATPAPARADFDDGSPSNGGQTDDRLFGRGTPCAAQYCIPPDPKRKVHYVLPPM